MKALERATGHLQARVGREVTLRRTPRLRFAYDESFDKGARIEQLLAEHEPMPDSIPDPAADPDSDARAAREDAAAPAGEDPAGEERP
jgi:ribosome-binding factor A